MTIYSTEVADNTDALSVQHNLVRRDLLTHIHDGTETPAVDHDDLTNGGVGDTTNDHAAIDAHIAANRGEHSADSLAYIALSYGGQLKIQYGSGSINLGLVGGGWQDNVDTINFSPAYTNPPRCFLQQKSTTLESVAAIFANVSQATASVWALPNGDSGNYEFYWIALGI